MTVEGCIWWYLLVVPEQGRQEGGPLEYTAWPRHRVQLLVRGRALHTQKVGSSWGQWPKRVHDWASIHMRARAHTFSKLVMGHMTEIPAVGSLRKMWSQSGLRTGLYGESFSLNKKESYKKINWGVWDAFSGGTFVYYTQVLDYVYSNEREKQHGVHGQLIIDDLISVYI